MKRNNLIFLFILLLGTLVRIFVMNNRDLFVDEVYYWRVSQMNSWKNLFLISHWIKDHGILYYLWLKVLAFLVVDIPTLRLSNIVLYVVSSMTFYGYFKDKHGWGALLGVALFSFHRYFVYLSSTLSPYNLALCLTMISVSGLYSLNEKKAPFWNMFLIIGATVGAFYTDYSFFFMLPFYASFFMFVMSNTARSQKRYIVMVYGIVCVFILPGLIQFVSNMDAIRDLFANRYFEHSFLRFTYIMGGMLFLRAIPLLGSILMILPALIILFTQEKKDPLIYAYIGGIGMIFVSQRFFFPLFAERYMWPLYYLYILILVHFLKGKTWGVVMMTTMTTLFIIGGIVNYFVPQSHMFRAPGDISYEVKYSSLLINGKNNDVEQLIVLDNTSTSDVLIHYYFGMRYPSSDVYAESVKGLRKKIIILSPRIDSAHSDLQKLIKDKGKSCILYHIAFKKGKKEDVLKNTIVKQLGCEMVYNLDNTHGYVDSFKLIYSKKP